MSRKCNFCTWVVLLLVTLRVGLILNAIKRENEKQTLEAKNIKRKQQIDVKILHKTDITSDILFGIISISESICHLPESFVPCITKPSTALQNNGKAEDLVV